MPLFGYSPEQLRQQARTDFINQKRQALASLPNMGGGGLAGRLAQLGQTAGMALGGMGAKPDLDTEEVRIAEKRKKMLSDLFAGGKTPTMDSLLSGMGTMIKEGDYQGATGMMQLATQVGTLEAAKKKATAKGLKGTTETVTVDGGTQKVNVIRDATGEIVKQTPIDVIKPAKPPVTQVAKVTEKDREATLTQAKSVYKDMDFSDEYTPEDHDYFLDLISGEVSRRAEELRTKGKPVNRAKLNREVLKFAKKEGAIKKTGTGFFEDLQPAIDVDKLEVLFGVKKKEDNDKKGGLTPEQKKRLEELRAKQ